MSDLQIFLMVTGAVVWISFLSTVALILFGELVVRLGRRNKEGE